MAELRGAPPFDESGGGGGGGAGVRAVRLIVGAARGAAPGGAVGAFGVGFLKKQINRTI